MPHGMKVGLSPGNFVLDGTQPPPQKGTEPPIFAHIYRGQTVAWIKMPLGTEVGLSLHSIVLDRDTAPSPIFSQCPLWPNG